VCKWNLGIDVEDQKKKKKKKKNRKDGGVRTSGTLHGWSVTGKTGTVIAGGEERYTNAFP